MRPAGPARNPNALTWTVSDQSAPRTCWRCPAPGEAKVWPRTHAGLDSSVFGQWVTGSGAAETAL